MSKAIDFKDIRVGDRIEVTTTFNSGATIVQRDMVVLVRDGVFETNEFRYYSEGSGEERTYALIERLVDKAQIDCGVKILVDNFGYASINAATTDAMKLIRLGVVFPVELEETA